LHTLFNKVYFENVRIIEVGRAQHETHLVEAIRERVACSIFELTCLEFHGYAVIKELNKGV
jgi:hypothetical protein